MVMISLTLLYASKFAVSRYQPVIWTSKLCSPTCGLLLWTNAPRFSTWSEGTIWCQNDDHQSHFTPIFDVVTRRPSLTNWIISLLIFRLSHPVALSMNGRIPNHSPWSWAPRLWWCHTRCHHQQHQLHFGSRPQRGDIYIYMWDREWCVDDDFWVMMGCW